MTFIHENIATFAEILFVEKRPEQGRKLSFDSVTIYTFSHDIGDNPACRDGCPIRLGDDLLGKSKFGIEEYEEGKKARPMSRSLFLEENERTAL
jgi:hypothetical protein